MGQQGPAPVLVDPLRCILHVGFKGYHGSEFTFQVVDDSLTKGCKYQMAQVSQFGDCIVIGKRKEEESQVPSEYSSEALLREERRRLCH